MTAVQNSAPRLRLPAWLRCKLPASRSFGQTRQLLQALRLHTVCESASCPNHWECWGQKTATFMIGGDRCTRHCHFCAIATGKPWPLEPDEPARVAEAARRLGLKHVVITSVARDDLPDGGAGHFRQTIEEVRRVNPGISIEVLTPDFNGCEAALEKVLSARPEVFNHNLETVQRLTSVVRSRASYERSLAVLRKAKARGADTLYTKSGLMLGLGEKEDEVLAALRDLREAGCEIVTLGQYLQPTLQQLPVQKFVSPARFEELGRQARQMGFLHVASAPLVRSSYHAEDFAHRKTSTCHS